MSRIAAPCSVNVAISAWARDRSAGKVSDEVVELAQPKEYKERPSLLNRASA